LPEVSHDCAKTIKLSLVARGFVVVAFL